jgi:hypothetical protein
MTRRTSIIWRPAASAVIALAALLAATPAASAYITIGSGNAAMPGLSVDPAGTAYIAWNGNATGDLPLQFCRLPRAAAGCDAGVGATIAAPGTSLSRPFIAVAGDQVVVVQHRYGAGVPGFRALYTFTSNNRGATFGAGKVAGKADPTDAVTGPGATATVTWAGNEYVQNVPLAGDPPVNSDGISTLAWADWKAASPGYYSEAIALLDGLPAALLVSNTGAAQFRRHAGGDINAAANWTAPLVVAQVQHPRLASGPAGLAMITGDGAGSIHARTWNGSTFGAPVAIGPGNPPTTHLAQDGAGRLHAVYESGDASGRALVHAVSDDAGATWRKARLESETNAAYGFADTRVATAPDHLGVAVWIGGPHEVRVTRLGPDVPNAAPPPPLPPPPPAPVAPAPAAKPKPALAARGSATRLATRVRIRIRGELVAPGGVSDARACRGTVAVSVKRGRVVVLSRTSKVNRNCEFGFTAFVKTSKVKRAKKLAVRIRFKGNAALAAATKTSSVKVR